MNLSNRIRPDVEAAPWVIQEIKDLEIKLEQLRAELTELKQEAHDKHWPLANACRNLLPTAPTNIEQVQLVVAKLSELRTKIERLEDKLNAEKFRTCERCVEKTATRCIEIADPRDKHVAKMLRKEFGLRE